MVAEVAAAAAADGAAASARPRPPAAAAAKSVRATTDLRFLDDIVDCLPPSPLTLSTTTDADIVDLSPPMCPPVFVSVF